MHPSEFVSRTLAHIPPPAAAAGCFGARSCPVGARPEDSPDGFQSEKKMSRLSLRSSACLLAQIVDERRKL